MLVGKRPRPRPPVRRTTSTTGITFDITNTEEVTLGDNYDHRHGQGSKATLSAADETAIAFLAMSSSSPRNYIVRNNVDFLETSDFLRTCGFCKRRLAPGRDIYMYKGDLAFCSVECREQQMERDDERKN